jgi:hypothetical protein
MTFKIYDKQYANRLYMAGEDEIQFRDHLAEVPPAVAYRMSRISGSDFVIEDKTVPFNPEAWSRDHRLIWNCGMATAQGYRHVAEQTVKNLLALGVHVENPQGISGNPLSGGEAVSDDVRSSITLFPEPNTIEVQHCQPPAMKRGIVERQWAYTMFETTHTPKSWIKILNQMERVLVPSSWLVDSWREQGLTVPISVYGHGIDPAVYAFTERPEREVCTFLHLGQLSRRKGTDLVYRAFVDEFHGDPGARLILKNTFPIFPVPLGTPQVEYIHATYSRAQMQALFARADCFVFPTRGEGAGLPPLEAMACGLPTIVTGWSGPADYADPDDTLVLEYAMTRATEFDAIYQEFWEPGENAGLWAEPSYEQLRTTMRWVYEHRSQAHALGKRAATRIARDWTWSRKAQDLVQLLTTNASSLPGQTIACP